MTEKQNDTQAKPSAGALRAAAEIWKTGAVSLRLHGSQIRADTMAEIIDRETGMAELLETATAILDKFASTWEIYPASFHESDRHRMYQFFIDWKDANALEQAIAKCKGKGSE